MSNEDVSNVTKTKPKRARSRWIREWSKRFIVVGFGLFLGSLAIEIGLRILGISYFLPYQADQYCGTRLRPGIQGWYRREGVAFVKINSDGNRDVEHVIEKPAGVYRIAVLGDSYAEAMQVNLEETFWKVMEGKLNQDPPQGMTKIEVLNFGVSGYGTAQELQMLEHYVWDFEPDLVILAFLTGNDFTDNSRDLGFAQSRPYFDLVERELQLDDSFLQEPDYQHALRTSTKVKVTLINSSRLLQLVNQAKSALEQKASGDDKQPGLNELGLDADVYAPPQNSEWENAWDVTLAMVDEMNQASLDRGVEFFVVCLSNGVQVHPDGKVRAEFKKQHGIDSLFYPDHRLERHCEEEGIPSLFMAPKLLELAEKNGTFFHGFENTELGTGHWNQNGHRVTGEILADELSQIIQGDDKSEPQ